MHSRYIKWYQDLEAEGHEVGVYRKRPIIHPDLAYDYGVFCDLNSSRQSGFTVGPISMSEIYSYMKIHGIDTIQERIVLLERIKILDNEYLTIQAESLEKKNGKHGSSA